MSRAGQVAPYPGGICARKRISRPLNTASASAAAPTRPPFDCSSYETWTTGFSALVACIFGDCANQRQVRRTLEPRRFNTFSQG